MINVKAALLDIHVALDRSCNLVRACGFVGCRWLSEIKPRTLSMKYRCLNQGLLRMLKGLFMLFGGLSKLKGSSCDTGCC